jgi:hypothetical protein
MDLVPDKVSEITHSISYLVMAKDYQTAFFTIQRVVKGELSTTTIAKGWETRQRSAVP